MVTLHAGTTALLHLDLRLPGLFCTGSALRHNPALPGNNHFFYRNASACLANCLFNNLDHSGATGDLYGGNRSLFKCCMPQPGLLFLDLNQVSRKKSGGLLR